ILVLIAGIACFALTGLQLTRARALAERERRLALEAVRSGRLASPSETVKKEWLSARALAALARLHTRIWPKESAADIEDKLSRAGANVKLKVERFMGLRVMLVGLGLLSGITLAHCGKHIVIALVFAVAESCMTYILLRRVA